MDEASFVAGNFKRLKQLILYAKPTEKDTSVELPGVELGIFPLGLIITGVWAAVFVGTVGYGTIGRVQYREQYRRRIDREVAAAIRTI